MTRVLVTGITGQDGSLLARQLLDEGADVVGLSLSDNRPAHWASTPLEALRIYAGDLSDAAFVRGVIESVAPAEIYNLAGQSSVARSWDDPVGTAMSTGVGAVAVFDAAFHLKEDGADVRVVQASSAEIFGRPSEVPQTENTAVAPITPYGAAKAFAHHSAGVFRARGLFVTSCILYNHESVLRPDTFVTRKITKAVAEISVAGDGVLTLGNLDARRDWGWAPDYVDALVRACRAAKAEDYVIATGVAHTVEDFVAAAFSHAGITDWRQHVRVDPQFVRPVEPAVQVGDYRKAREILGWSPQTGFDDFVATMVDHDLGQLRASC